MITVNINSNAEGNLQRLLVLYKGNYDNLFNGMLEYKIRELKRGIRNIEIDFTYHD